MAGPKKEKALRCSHFFFAFFLPFKSEGVLGFGVLWHELGFLLGVTGICLLCFDDEERGIQKEEILRKCASDFSTGLYIIITTYYCYYFGLFCCCLFGGGLVYMSGKKAIYLFSYISTSVAIALIYGCRRLFAFVAMDTAKKAFDDRLTVNFARMNSTME